MKNKMLVYSYTKIIEKVSPEVKEPGFAVEKLGEEKTEKESILCCVESNRQEVRLPYQLCGLYTLHPTSRSLFTLFPILFSIWGERDGNYVLPRVIV